MPQCCSRADHLALVVVPSHGATGRDTSSRFEHVCFSSPLSHRRKETCTGAPRPRAEAKAGRSRDTQSSASRASLPPARGPAPGRCHGRRAPPSHFGCDVKTHRRQESDRPQPETSLRGSMAESVGEKQAPPAPRGYLPPKEAAAKKRGPSTMTDKVQRAKPNQAIKLHFREYAAAWRQQATEANQRRRRSLQSPGRVGSQLAARALQHASRAQMMLCPSRR